MLDFCPLLGGFDGVVLCAWRIVLRAALLGSRWFGGVRRRRAALLLACAGVIGPAGPATAADWVTVRAQPVAHPLPAYGQIEPMAVVQVRAPAPGVVGGLRVVPGSTVRAGEVLARLGGPGLRALRVAREQALRAAAAREAAAAAALQATQRQFLAQLATRQAVDDARSALAAARAAAQTADAQWRALRDLQVVRAPVSGTVLALRAADGEQLASGQTLLTLQPAGRLWVRAAYYGADAALLHPGMTGTFRPSGGGQALAVKIAALAPALAPDGGLRVGLIPAAPAVPGWWIAGQWGDLDLAGPARSMVLVPTQALILDQGRWWVLVHTPAGDKPQPVVPGPAQGWQTAIASGLRPGQQVVVTDAFLDAHRGIARAYTPPD